MRDVNDMDLMREYAGQNSEAAFAELVHRHINLVYSVALRYVGNAQDAQDVTQAVFIILAKKAASLCQRTTFTGWLYETTRFTASQLLRTRTRQQAREQEAYMQSTLNDSNTDGVWKQLAPILEEAMTRLGEKERALLVLRFFENKSGAETAALLGIQEWAAHKRVARAVEKLRRFFTKRGVILPAAALTAAISANAVQAVPVMLGQSVAAVAMAKGSVATVSTLALVKGTMKIMAWIKVKTAVGVTAGVLLAAGTATVAVSTLMRAQAPPATVPANVVVSAIAPIQPASVQVDPSPPPASQRTSPPGPARVVVPKPQVVVATPQKPPVRLIYPTAPRRSEILANALAAGGGNGNFVTIPTGLHIQIEYGNLFQKLHLTPDQIAAFIKIMVDSQEQKSAFMRDHQLDPKMLAGLTGEQVMAAQMEHQQELQMLMQPIDQAADSQIKRLLGSDGNYNYYQIYTDQNKERMVVMNGYRDGLDAAGVPPLTLDTDEQLVNLVYRARISANNDAVAEAQQLPQIMRQAATFLTPAQVKVLAQYTRSFLSAPMTGVGGIGTRAGN
jgi:RNA polymerase sigma factor (sigma-70 family)